MTTTELPELLSSQETADALRMHKLTLLRKAREGLIGSVRSGNRVFFTPEHIKTYLADGETKAARPKPTRSPRYAK